MTAGSLSETEAARIARRNYRCPVCGRPAGILQGRIKDHDLGITTCRGSGTYPPLEFTTDELATLQAFDAAPTPPEVREAAVVEEALRDALLKHHPIAHTMTGPLKGCRCGQVKLGQDVIAHVTDSLRAVLTAVDPS